MILASKIFKLELSKNLVNCKFTFTGTFHTFQIQNPRTNYGLQ